jgi:Domain of unknown function (DUF6894)
MPRYFFALTDQDSLSLADDEVGEEFDRVEAARQHAMAVARELSRHQHPCAQNPSFDDLGSTSGLPPKADLRFARYPNKLASPARYLSPLWRGYGACRLVSARALPYKSRPNAPAVTCSGGTG